MTQIGETYSVSRGTARRVLDLLKEWGLTDSVPGWGTFVKDAGTGQAGDRPGIP